MISATFALLFASNAYLQPQYSFVYFGPVGPFEMIRKNQLDSWKEGGVILTPKGFSLVKDSERGINVLYNDHSTSMDTLKSRLKLLQWMNSVDTFEKSYRIEDAPSDARDAILYYFAQTGYILNVWLKPDSLKEARFAIDPTLFFDYMDLPPNNVGRTRWTMVDAMAGKNAVNREIFDQPVEQIHVSQEEFMKLAAERNWAMSAGNLVAVISSQPTGFRKTTDEGILASEVVKRLITELTIANFEAASALERRAIDLLIKNRKSSDIKKGLFKFNDLDPQMKELFIQQSKLNLSVLGMKNEEEFDAYLSSNPTVGIRLSLSFSTAGGSTSLYDYNPG